jgi:hypothetical protein
MTAARTGTGSRVLDELADVIGEDAAYRFAEEFIGQQVYIPKSPEGQPRIAAAIGPELAGKLCDVFGKTTVAIPMAILVKRRVVELAAQGMTKQEIARTLCIRQSRVFAILKRKKEEG